MINDEDVLDERSCLHLRILRAHPNLMIVDDGADPGAVRLWDPVEGGVAPSPTELRRREREAADVLMYTDGVAMAMVGHDLVSRRAISPVGALSTSLLVVHLWGARPAIVYLVEMDAQVRLMEKPAAFAMEELERNITQYVPGIEFAHAVADLERQLVGER